MYLKITSQEVLILSRKRRKTQILRKALLESNREYKCEKCGLGPEWQKEKLIIEIHHINGNNLDNRLENLQFLCPNCHSQTDNFRNHKKYCCQKCNIKLEKNNKYCSNCRKESHKEKIDWPSKEELEKIVWLKPLTLLGKELGLTDNSIRKRCKKLKIELPPNKYWQKTNKIIIDKVYTKEHDQFLIESRSNNIPWSEIIIKFNNYFKSNFKQGNLECRFKLLLKRQRNIN